MSCFQKLNLVIDVQRVREAPTRLIQTVDVHNRDRYKYTQWVAESAAPTPLMIYALPDDVVDAILAQLPPAVVAKETPGVFLMRMPKPCAESRSLPPHVDRGRRAAINVYLDCANETTQFFEADEEAERLDLVGSFMAKPGESWLLDVSKPHAVLMGEAKERTGVTISFRRTRFAELAALLAAA